METSEYFGISQLSSQSFKELLPIFFNEIENDFKSLEESNKKGDELEIRQLAHKIKGTAATYSAKLIFEAAKNLQEALENNYTSDIASQIGELELAIESTNRYAKINLI
jgi:HPt (histidine-containing phosphotransfer) domain-containing protein